MYLDIMIYVKHTPKQWKNVYYVKPNNPLSFQSRFPKMDQYAGEKRLVHGTKHHKDSQSQSLELPL